MDSIKCKRYHEVAKANTCAKFQRKMVNPASVRAPRSFQLSHTKDLVSSKQYIYFFKYKYTTF